MASRKSRRAQLAKQGNTEIKKVVLFLLVVILVFVGLYEIKSTLVLAKPVVQASKVEKTEVSTDQIKADNRQEFQHRLGLILSEFPEAKVLPRAVKEKAALILEMNRRGTLTFVSETQRVENMFVVMSCACDARSMSLVGAKVPGIVVFPWITQLSRKMSSEQATTLFALSLYHEAVHLEGYPLPSLPSREEYLREETRAYVRTSLDAVRPMIDAGHWVPYSALNVDRTLRMCGDDPSCPSFRGLMERENQAMK